MSSSDASSSYESSSDASSSDSDEPLKPRMTIFEEYGPKITKRIKKKLYPAQWEALTGLVDWFETRETRDKTAVVVMPTGSGKTGVIACLPYVLGKEVFKGSLSIDLHKPILIIAPGIAILEQLKKNFKSDHENQSFLRKMEIILDEDAKVAIYSVKVIQSSTDLLSLQHDCKDEIILSNAQKFVNQPDRSSTWRDLPSDMFSVVIVDEAHHLPTKMWQDIIDHFTALTSTTARQDTKVIFFTATPRRADKKPLTKDQSRRRFKYAYYLSREEAISKRYIRQIELHPIRFKSPSKKKRYDSTDAHARLMYGCALVNKAMERLKEKDMKQPLPGNMNHAALIITKDKSDADMLKVCTTVQHPHFEEKIDHIHSGMTAEEQKEVLKKFRNGTIRILIVVEMLREGFDHPPISVVAIATRIRSPVKFAQFIGRAQRVVKVSGKVEHEAIRAEIITHEYFEQEHLFDSFKEPLIPTDDNDERFTTIDSEND